MPKKPNFLFVMSDQHAPDVVGAFGHPAVLTPNLDRLAARGVSFRNAYCAYPMCTPSRASFMTGLLAPQHGVWELGTPLRSDLPTWAHVLRRAGYATSICGRMHFVGHDKLHGFERRVYPDTDKLTPYAYANWDQPQEDTHVMLGAVRGAGATEALTPLQEKDNEAAAAAIREITCLHENGDNRPWALVTGLIQPHPPYRVSRPYFDRYAGRAIPMPHRPPGGKSFEALIPEQMTGSRKWLGLTADGASEAEVANARQAYYGMITAVDELIGRLVAHLEALGVRENTWIVYLSDHGDNLGEHGMWSKLNFFENSVRVPMIVAPPACPLPGASCREAVSLIDWLPTLLELTGQSFPEPLPGRSLLPLLRNPSGQGEDRAIVADYACDGTRVPMRMVRRGDWKACFAAGFPPTLFNLKADPGEWDDLGRDPAHHEILDALHAVATADGWNAETLRRDILLHQRRLRYISEAEK